MKNDKCVTLSVLSMSDIVSLKPTRTIRDRETGSLVCNLATAAGNAIVYFTRKGHDSYVESARKFAPARV